MKAQFLFLLKIMVKEEHREKKGISYRKGTFARKTMPDGCYEVLCGGRKFMLYGKSGNSRNNAGNIKWRRQCLCLRRSFREVCRTICRLSDCLCGKVRI